MTETAKILTIEDESPIRKGIVAYLEDSGFTMLEANDGPSGLEIFRREGPDVVLCDLRLPGIDGLEVLATITTESPDFSSMLTIFFLSSASADIIASVQ